MSSDRKSWNSSLRPIAKNKIGKPKKPAVKRKPSLDEVKERFRIVTAAMLGDKPRKPMKKRADSNKGWYSWAVENVWNKRNHWCEVCGIMLGNSDTPSPSFFSHLLPRGSYRKYKLDERNVILKCQGCHDKWHDQGPDKLQHKPEWRAICKMYFQLRNENNGI